MNRIIIFLFLGFLITSCGSRKKVKDHSTPPKVVVTVTKPSKPTPSKNTPIINNTLDYIAYFKTVAIDEMQLFDIPAVLRLLKEF